jgi:hypothetical protein
LTTFDEIIKNGEMMKNTKRSGKQDRRKGDGNEGNEE